MNQKNLYYIPRNTNQKKISGSIFKTNQNTSNKIKVKSGQKITGKISFNKKN